MLKVGEKFYAEHMSICRFVARQVPPPSLRLRVTTATRRPRSMRCSCVHDVQGGAAQRRCHTKHTRGRTRRHSPAA